MDRNSDRDHSRAGDGSTFGAGSVDVRKIITFVLSFHRLLANLSVYW